MSMKLAKVLPAAAILGAAVLMTGEAQAALVNYTVGSATITAITTSTADITTQTAYDINILYALGPGTGSLAPYLTPLFFLPTPTTVNFTTPTASSFNWTDAGVGSFVANLVKFAGESINGNQITMSYDIFGTFTIGSDFLNAGKKISADETWALTQTGGPGNAVSMSGTFNAPSSLSVPEPGTLGLLGLGLVAAAGAMRRRKQDV